MNISQFVKEKLNIFASVILIFLFPLFFYNLGGYSLIDFDEAWYGEIARNIIINRNPFLLYFNGEPYTDHPPFGFLLIAISEVVFGINEFAVRFPSALGGFGSLILTWLIGKKLFSNVVGVGAMLVLGSSVWFVLRSRQGDLDTILLFFYLLTIFFALKIKENSKWIFALAISFAFLFLTKSFFGLTILPAILVIFLIYEIRLPLKKLVFALIIFLAITSAWFIPNFVKYKLSFINHAISVGFKPDDRHQINFREIHRSLTVVYLHFGVRKWFYPAIFSLLICTLFLLKNKKSFSANKNLSILYTWTLVPSIGFLTSSKTEIWHLIPIYPVLSIFISFVTLKISTLTIGKLNLVPTQMSTSIAEFSTLVFFILSSTFFIWDFKDEVKVFDHEQSPLAQVASYAEGLQEPLFISSDLSIPATAVFYSQKQVRVVRDEDPPINTIPSLIEFGPKPLLLITQDWRLKADKVEENNYKILKQEADYQLILVN